MSVAVRVGEGVRISGSRMGTWVGRAVEPGRGGVGIQDRVIGQVLFLVYDLDRINQAILY